MIDPAFADARIMIVDDQQPNVLLLEKLLKNEGYSQIRSLLDPREAARTYQEFKPDLVLLDLMMPHLDGYQVLAQLAALEPHSYVPVLVLTADNAQSSRLRALEAGARDFLSKPYDVVEVRARIQNMLEVRLLHNQLADQNRLLGEKVRQRTRELEQSQLEVVRRLALASEFRDDQTGLHTDRMSRLAARLAEAAGLSTTECDMILQAAPMHDVGKIGIPDAILLKPGPLTPDEWETMKTHVRIGATLLSGGSSDLMQMAHTIAWTHHENWDGSGYPQGLKGEAIPLSGRICHLADVFDALTSDRPYKKAWSHTDAAAEIVRMSGRHFDPSLVDRFEWVFSELVAIIRECR
ncbi:MAG TPA: HD domain-containing phosphohydrolase [Symbiobacteriaceae bacterium]|jgi:putative two-component system response regulator